MQKSNNIQNDERINNLKGNKNNNTEKCRSSKKKSGVKVAPENET